MTKFLMRFILSLCILLLSGYSQLYAHAYRDCNHPTSIKLPKELAHASFDIAQKSLASISKSAPSGREKVFFYIDTSEFTEEEEEKSLSFKKNLERRYDLSVIFYTHLFNLFFSSIQEILSVDKCFSYITSYKRYLIFQVFRI